MAMLDLIDLTLPEVNPSDDLAAKIAFNNDDFIEVERFPSPVPIINLARPSPVGHLDSARSTNRSRSTQQMSNRASSTFSDSSCCSEDTQDALHKLGSKLRRQKRERTLLRKRIQEATVASRQQTSNYEREKQALLQGLQDAKAENLALKNRLQAESGRAEKNRTHAVKLKRQVDEAKGRISKWAEQFQCIICYDTISDCVIKKCGHEFCWDCLHHFFRVQREDNFETVTCPTCRAAAGASEDDDAELVIRLHRHYDGRRMRTGLEDLGDSSHRQSTM